MVQYNRGRLEPSDETLTTNNQVVLAPDTDTDEEEYNHDGYELLAGSDFHNPTNNDSEGDDDSNDDANNDNVPSSTSPGESSLPSITSAESEIVREVWSEEKSKNDIEMDSEKVSEVKQAMLNVQLPQSSIPEWASNIPEDEWKKTLMEKLESMKSNS